MSHPPRLLTLISGNLSHVPNAIYPSRRIHQPPRKSRFGLLNADMSYATCISVCSRCTNGVHPSQENLSQMLISRAANVALSGYK